MSRIVSLADKYKGKPMLAFVAEKGDSDKKDYFAERKFDGTRVFVIKNGDSVRLMVARGDVNTDYTEKYPLIVRAAKKLKCRSCVLDAEFVFFDKRGRDVFLTMSAGADRIESLKYKVMVFDILFFNGRDVHGLPIEGRKLFINKIIPKGLPIVPVFPHPNKIAFFNKVVRSGGEGLVLKKRGSFYVPRRSRDWLKLKKGKELDVVVKGFTVSKDGPRLPYFRALKCYYPLKGVLSYVGDVGTGFNLDDLKQITPMLKTGKPFVIQVRFMEFSPNMHMRHPVFVRLRPDKSVAEVMRG